MKTPVRAVLDTNVLVSALVLGGGRLAPLRSAWQEQRLVPLLSRTTADELIRVLAYSKFRLSKAEQQELLGDLLPYCEVVRMPARLPAIPACRDPFDAPFLELAVVGKAPYLVSGDRDLHAIKSGTAFRILTPAEFLHVTGT